MVRQRFALLLAAGALAGLPVAAFARPASNPRATVATTCSSLTNQAAAQRAADTRDPDGDGLYCESLPCPCPAPGRRNAGRRPAPASPPTPPAPSPQACSGSPSARQVPEHPPPLPRRPAPRLAAHARAQPPRRRRPPRAPARGRPDPRRLRPRRVPAGGRPRQGQGLERGRTRAAGRPTSATSPSSENRSHGSTLGIKLRRFCDGTRFRYVFR